MEQCSRESLPVVARWLTRGKNALPAGQRRTEQRRRKREQKAAVLVPGPRVWAKPTADLLAGQAAALEEEEALWATLNEEFGNKEYHWGCTHSHALNFNPEATYPAGNCVYAAEQSHSWMQ